MYILNESIFDGMDVLKEKNGPFNDLYELFEKMIDDNNDADVIMFDIDGNSAFIAEASDENGTFVFELKNKIIPQELDWVFNSTMEELGLKNLNEFKGKKFQFRLDGKILEIDKLKIMRPPIEMGGDEVQPAVVVMLSDTGTQAKAPADLGKRPTNAAEFKAAFEKSGKKPAGMPQAWIVYGDRETPTVPNFAMKQGNFVRVKLITLDELAADEGHDVAETLRMFSRVPQDLEFVFEHGGSYYEIDSMSAVPGEGLRVEMRKWGEIDESKKNKYAGTIKRWKKFIAESETAGIWATGDNDEMLEQARRFERLF